jgi:hypothetical protein
MTAPLEDRRLEAVKKIRSISRQIASPQEVLSTAIRETHADVLAEALGTALGCLECGELPSLEVKTKMYETLAAYREIANG